MRSFSAWVLHLLLISDGDFMSEPALALSGLPRTPLLCGNCAFLPRAHLPHEAVVPVCIVHAVALFSSPDVSQSQ